jgi:uncharacterized protein
MSSVSFADVVHHSISFSTEIECEALILELIDTRWVQRLRDISQTANVRSVYMFSEHSRFGHALGSAFLACTLMSKLSGIFRAQVEPHRAAVCAAALLHDIGHLAPGSHTAQKTWFPGQPDTHEALSALAVEQDPEIRGILLRYGPRLQQAVAAILRESAAVPAWTHEVISGGGWNVDRGNWCIVDSIMAGVEYGKYNIPALTDSIVLTADDHLAIRENRLDAMIHFAVSRHAMYQQIYQHRVLLSNDSLSVAVAKRARAIGSALEFADSHMRRALEARSAADLDLATVIGMRDPWWRYHLYQWCEGADAVLADLSRRLINRKLFKTVRIRDEEDSAPLIARARAAVSACGYDPEYYLHEVSTEDVHAGDSKQSMLVLMDNGQVKALNESEPLLRAMIGESRAFHKRWLVMPQEAKLQLGRER